MYILFLEDGLVVYAGIDDVCGCRISMNIMH